MVTDAMAPWLENMSLHDDINWFKFSGVPENIHTFPMHRVRGP